MSDSQGVDVYLDVESRIALDNEARNLGVSRSWFLRALLRTWTLPASRNMRLSEFRERVQEIVREEHSK